MITELTRAVTRIDVKTGDEVLLISDLHWDNPHCDRALLKRHMDQAVAKGAYILVNGDLFCAMQGKYDRRSCKDDVRPEHQVATYLDALVETAIEWFAPYAAHLAVIGRGNHETAITKNHETDLTDRLCAGLRIRHGSKVVAGGYGFWVHLQDARNGTKKIFAHHGAGGGGPVTRGIIQTNRRACFVDGADIIWSGHIHEAWALESMKVGTDKNGNVNQSTVYHVSTPTYKEEYGDGHLGWHVERMAPPKPLGGYWLKLSTSKRGSGGRDTKQLYITMERTD